VVRVASGAWLARKIRRSPITIRSTITAFDGHQPIDRPGEVMTAQSYPVDHAQRTLTSTKEADQPTDGR
jgi:hypothetical protein